MDDYLTVMETALALGISYPNVIARIRKGKITHIKRGWMIFIHKDVVASLKDAAARKDDKSTRKHMEAPTR